MITALRGKVAPTRGVVILTTAYATVSVCCLPSLSVAVTAKECQPSVDVLIAAPVAAHVCTPMPASAQVKAGVSDWPCANAAAIDGAVIVTVGGLASTRNVVDGRPVRRLGEHGVRAVAGDA